jgi:4-hydroxy-2-oxoheptanedioate aldolase
LFRKNTTKEKLKLGQVVIGIRMDYHSPDIIEILGDVGFDFVYYDCEHGPMNEETCQAMIRTAELVGLTPLVRVPANEPWYILRALDSGAMGIIIPHCNTKEDAQNAVKASKYPPEGERGIAGRSIRISGMRPAQYIVEANREIMVIAMIEEAQTLENLSEILTVDGLDVLWIGRGDLSLSLGVPGQYNHPKVQQAVDRVITEGRAAGKIVGVGAIEVGDPESVKQFARQGAQFFSLNSANLFKMAARTWLEKAR